MTSCPQTNKRMTRWNVGTIVGSAAAGTFDEDLGENVGTEISLSSSFSLYQG